MDTRQFRLPTGKNFGGQFGGALSNFGFHFRRPQMGPPKTEAEIRKGAAELPAEILPLWKPKLFRGH